MYEVALSILKKIDEKGFQAYIVGGYSRDKYMKRKSNDIDICTSAKVDDLVKIFKDVDTRYKNYGNVIVTEEGYKYQITTFRQEKYKKNRNDMDVKFLSELKDDLFRRDFIMNTLCIDKDGKYIDLMNARSDIDNKVITLIGSIDRLKDDPLRILRALRFVSELKFELDPQLEEGIKEYSYLVSKLSKAKISKEIKRIDKKIIDKYLNNDIININEMSDNNDE